MFFLYKKQIIDRLFFFCKSSSKSMGISICLLDTIRNQFEVFCIRVLHAKRGKGLLQGIGAYEQKNGIIQ